MKSILFFISLCTILLPLAVVAQPAPSGLEAAYNPANDRVDLSWNIGDGDPAPNYYYIHRKIDDGNFGIYMATVELDFQDRWVDAGHTYGYRISAVYPDDSRSDQTSSVSVSVPRSSGGNGGGHGGGKGKGDDDDDNDEYAKPRDLDGEYSNGAIVLTWRSPDSDRSPDSYNVYRRDNDKKYAYLAGTPDTTYQDFAIQSNRKYRYFVTAVYTDSVNHESDRSKSTEVRSGRNAGGQQVKITFTSEPPNTAIVGEEFVYQPTIETRPAGVDICWKLLWGPDDLTMDSTNGAITWTPTEKGQVNIAIQATACATGYQGKSTQEFKLRVLPNGSGAISGTITNEDGDPLEGVRVTLFGSSSRHGNGGKGGGGKGGGKGGKHGNDWTLKAETDAEGHYAFNNIQPGKYYLRADSPDEEYYDLWYDNARKSRDADRVTVGEDSSVTINFVLPFKQSDRPEQFTITGFVRDTASAPIAGAKVKLYRQKARDGERYDDDEDHNDWGKSGDDRQAVTDSSGAYAIKGSAGDYILRAKAKGYYEQWWDGQETPFEAFVVSLHADTGDLNFALTPRAKKNDGNGMISGTVTRAGDGAPVRVAVVAFSKTGNNHFALMKGSDRSGDDGGYGIDDLPAGYYIIGARGEDNLVTTWYSTSGGTTDMDNATLLFLDSKRAENIDIAMVPDATDGLSTIAGQVRGGRQGTISGQLAGGLTPVSGAVVTAYNGEGEAVGSAITVPGGSFASSGLAPGEYAVIFQKPGFGSVRTTVAVGNADGDPTITVVNGTLASGLPADQVGLMGVKPGWNLVSLPVTAATTTFTELFPSAESRAFTHSNGYKVAAELEYGTGYWTKFGSDAVLSVQGTERLDQMITIKKGWNMVGTLSDAALAGAVETEPAGILATPFYGYEGGYQAAELLMPGKGYWVHATAAGTLRMNAAAGFTDRPGGEADAGAADPNAADGVKSEVEILFVDSHGGSQSLMVGERSTKEAPNLLMVLPPLPPPGGFDVRFASGTRLEQMPAGEGTPGRLTILVQTAGGSLTVSWQGLSDRMTYALYDESGKVVARSSDGTSTIQVGENSTFYLESVMGAVPTTYRIYQNYPNPFNPVTKIAYDLPQPSSVQVKIYNAIGQQVSTLVSGEMGAGAQHVEWDGANFATGLYFARIEAVSLANPSDSYVSTIKMLLVK